MSISVMPTDLTSLHKLYKWGKSSKLGKSPKRSKSPKWRFEMLACVTGSILLGGAMTAIMPTDAMARSDSILTVVTPSNVTNTPKAADPNVDGQFGGHQNDGDQSTATPVDLTNLIKPKTDDNISLETTTPVSDGTAEEKPSENNISASASISSPSISLSRKNPSSIRLAAVGIDRDALDGLDSLMWQGSDATTVLALRQALAASTPPSAVTAALDHLNMARVVPPEGFVDQAPALIEARLMALAKAGLSDDLAIMVEQLPQQDQWQDWQKWLAIHHLMTRNDNAACTAALEQVQQTLDPLWHQVNTFCSVVAGNADQASFALDILSDSGLSSPNFDRLMRHLTNQSSGGGSITVEDLDLTTMTGLELVLMDSARVTIEPAALLQLDQGHFGSVMALRYLSDDSLRLLSARQFNQEDITTLKTTWALLPIKSMSATEALTRFGVGGAADEVAVARIDAWQAIAAEKDDRTAAQLAYEAMMIDYNLAGIRGFGLWLPIIERGANDLDVESKIGPILGFVPETSRLMMSEEALAWHDLLAFGRRPIRAATLDMIEGFDSLPLLRANELSIEKIDWLALPAHNGSLSSRSVNLPYHGLMQLTVAAEQGRKAETLMRAALLLDGVDLASLNRDDAAQIITALVKTGLKDTARALSRDILVSWGAARHFDALTAQSSDPSASET